MNRQRVRTLGALLVGVIVVLIAPCASRSAGAQASLSLDVSNGQLGGGWSVGGSAQVMTDPATSAATIMLSQPSDAVISPAFANPRLLSLTVGGTSNSTGAAVAIDKSCDGGAGFILNDTIVIPDFKDQRTPRIITSKFKPSGQCALRIRLLRLESGQLFVQSAVVTLFSGAEVQQYKNDSTISANVALQLRQTLANEAANARLQHLQSSRQAVLDEAFELAELARRSSGMRNVALSMTVMRARAELNDPTKYVDLSALVARARALVHPNISDVIGRLAGRVAGGLARLAGLTPGPTGLIASAVTAVTKSLPLAEFGHTIALEVARAGAGSHGVDTKHLSEVWHTKDKAGALALYDTLTTHLDELLTALDQENERVAEYGRQLDQMQLQSLAVRSNAVAALHRLVAIGSPSEASTNKLVDALLDPRGSLKRESPAFTAFAAQVSREFGLHAVPNNPTPAALSAVDAFTTEVDSKLGSSSSVSAALGALACRFESFYQELGADFGRTDVLQGVSAELNAKWNAQAAPMRKAVADALTTFRQAYGDGTCVAEASIP